MMHKMKSQGITEAITIHPKENMNVYTKFHGIFHSKPQMSTKPLTDRNDHPYSECCYRCLKYTVVMLHFFLYSSSDGQC